MFSIVQDTVLENPFRGVSRMKGLKRLVLSYACLAGDCII
jgi:hypothetical protein